MHLTLSLYALFAAWKWSDWRNWKKYHSTMLFLSLINLVYNFISFSADHFLWKTVPDLLPSNAATELIYTGIILPCTVLLFLSNFPKESVKVIVHFIKYIFIYSVLETILYAAGRMEYNHGWSIWHSILFYFLMFPAIIIHYKRPLLAYIVFIIITISGVIVFQIPVQ